MGIPRRCRRRRCETMRHATVRLRGGADRWSWEGKHGRRWLVVLCALGDGRDLLHWYARGTVGDPSISTFRGPRTNPWCVSIKNVGVLAPFYESGAFDG